MLDKTKYVYNLKNTVIIVPDITLCTLSRTRITYNIINPIVLQVGNAVPPPMGRAIGLEVKKCLEWKALKEPKQEEDEEVKEEEMETDVQPKIEESPVKAGSSRC